MVSIIVPIYRVEKYLERCICSILRQTYKDFELILVDDGSPDLCSQICDIWQKKDSRVKVIHKENGGLSDARNEGLRIAKGDRIAFVDSDDWISESFLEVLVKSMDVYGCDIVECNIIKTDCFNEEEKGKSEIVDVDIYNKVQALKELIEDVIFHQHVWNKLYKKEVIDKVLFEKGKTNEDEFWTYQVFEKANVVGKINVPLYFYFQHQASIMGSKYSITRLDVLEAKRQRQQFIEEKYPDLASTAKINLFFTCIFQGQLVLLFLKGKDYYYAKGVIDDIRKENVPNLKELKKIIGTKRIWGFLAKNFFWVTCRVRNFLKKGF